MSFSPWGAQKWRGRSIAVGACLVEYLLLILFAFSFALIVLPSFTDHLSFALMRGFSPSVHSIASMQQGGGSQSNNTGGASTAGPCGNPGQSACPNMAGSGGGDHELES